MRARGTTALAAGSGLSGLLAYVFFALTTRALGSEAAAPVSVLWAYWSFASAALTFPLQHWVTRTVQATEGEDAVRRSLARVSGVVLLVSAAGTGAAWVLREPLFGRADPAFPLLVGAVSLGAALVGYVRGVLGGRQRFAWIGASLVAENGVRCLAAGVAIGLGIEEPAAYGTCLLIGYVAAVAWPGVFRLGRAGHAQHGSWAGFLGGAAGGQLAAQAVLTGGPVVLALAGGAPTEVTALFAGLALFRAPYTLAIGTLAPLTSLFTRLVVERRADRLRATRSLLLAAGAVSALLAVVLGWFLGPWLLRLVFGDDVRLAAWVCAVLAVASVLAMVNLVSTVMVMAHGRTSRLLGSWLLAVVPAAVWFPFAPGGALQATVVAFLVVEAVAAVLLVRAEVVATARLQVPAP